MVKLIVLVALCCVSYSTLTLANDSEEHGEHHQQEPHSLVNDATKKVKEGLAFGAKKVSSFRKKAANGGLKAYQDRIISLIQKGKMKVCEEVPDLAALAKRPHQVFVQTDFKAIQDAVHVGMEGAKARLSDAAHAAGDLASQLKGKVPESERLKYTIDGFKAVQKLGSDLFLKVELPDGRAVFERLKVTDWKTFVEERKHDIESGKVQLFVKKSAREVANQAHSTGQKVYDKINSKETKKWVHDSEESMKHHLESAYNALPESIKKNAARFIGKIRKLSKDAYSNMPAGDQVKRYAADAGKFAYDHLPSKDQVSNAANAAYNHLPSKDQLAGAAGAARDHVSNFFGGLKGKKRCPDGSKPLAFRCPDCGEGNHCVNNVCCKE